MSEKSDEDLRESVRARSLGNFMQNLQARFDAKRAELLAKYGLDFEKRVTTFGINKAEQGVIDDWLAQVQAEVVAKQSKEQQDLGAGQPYYGAVGGGVSYTFTPTSLGMILTVKEAISGKELNVTDALDWYFYD